jgi:phage gpG-like protein
MAVTWSQRLDAVALQQLLRSPRGGVMRNLLRRGLLVETQAKRNLSGIGGPKRIDTGRLRASISTVAVTRNGEPAVLVGTNVKYAGFVHRGTGLYGPRHAPIRPRTAKFLRFKPRGAGRYVYARQVKGMKPNPFLTNALSAARG